jgi:hypothetical protein
MTDVLNLWFVVFVIGVGAQTGAFFAIRNHAQHLAGIAVALSPAMWLAWFVFGNVGEGFASVGLTSPLMLWIYIPLSVGLAYAVRKWQSELFLWMAWVANCLTLVATTYAINLFLQFS